MAGPKKCLKGMVYIPGGSFKMGSTNGGPNERPVRKIEISPLCADKHVVTNAEWEKYEVQRRMKQSITARSDNAKTSPMPKRPKGFDRPNQPFVLEEWHRAKAYCEAQGKRLPTEAEWEYMARGPGEFEYGTKSGELKKSEAHYDSDSMADVCSYPENGFGLCDMAGNVWEWVADWYQRDAYTRMESKNPKGPANGEYRVIRGGSWANVEASVLRAAQRVPAPKPWYRDNHYGFRCVSTPRDSN